MRDDLNTSNLEPAYTDASLGPDTRPVVEPTFVTNAPGDIRGYKPLEEIDEGTDNTKRIVGAAAVVVLIGALGAVTYFSGVLNPPATQATQIASNQVPPPATPTAPPPSQAVAPPAAPDVTPPAQAATAPAERPVRTARTRAPRQREQTVQPVETEQASPPPAIAPSPDTMSVPQTAPTAPDVTPAPAPAPQPSTDQPAPPPQ